MNFIYGDGLVDLTYLNVLDIIEDPNGKIDHLIGDGNICMIKCYSLQVVTHCLLFIFYSLFYILLFLI